MKSSFLAADRINAPESFRNGLQWHRIFPMDERDQNHNLMGLPMEPAKSIKWLIRVALLFVLLTTLNKWTYAQSKPIPAAEIRVVEFVPPVEVLRAGSAVWDPVYTNQVLHVGD